jgi:hypothetical protein
VLSLRRLAGVITSALLIVGAVAYSVPAYADGDPPPIVVTPGGGYGGGQVGITVTAPGGVGVTITPAGASAGPTNPCDLAPSSTECQTWYEANICTATVDQLAGIVPDVNAALAAAGCPLRAQVNAAVSAATLAQQAYGQLRLPAPLPSQYPSGTLRDGRAYTIVNTFMWFWTAPAAWASLTKTVCAGALCATATAKPAALSFDPGNGDGAVSCAGPGTPWAQPAGTSWVPTQQPQGCDYRYLKSSYGDANGEVTATYSITWDVTWAGTDRTAGTLNPLVTATDSRFAVAELQAVMSQ